MSDSQSFEVLQALIEIEGFPKLLEVLYRVFQANELLPNIRKCERKEGVQNREGQSRADKVCNDTNWQPIGIQVAHALTSLCIYPETISHLSGSGKWNTGNLTIDTALSHQNSKSTSYQSLVLNQEGAQKPKPEIFEEHDHFCIGALQPPKENMVFSEFAVTVTSTEGNSDPTPDGRTDFVHRPVLSHTGGYSRKRQSRMQSQTAHNLETYIQKTEAENNPLDLSLSLKGSHGDADVQVLSRDVDSRPVKTIRKGLRASLTASVDWLFSPSSPKHRASVFSNLFSSEPEIKETVVQDEQRGELCKRTLVKQIERENEDASCHPQDFHRRLSQQSHLSDPAKSAVNEEDEKEEENEDVTGKEIALSKNSDSFDIVNTNPTFQPDSRNSLDKKWKPLDRSKSKKTARAQARQVNEELTRKRNLIRLVERVHREAEEKIRQEEKPPRWWQIHPSSSFHKCWDILMGVNLLYVLCVTPVHISFELDIFNHRNWAWFVDQIVTACFATDILVNFCTGVYVSTEVNSDGSESTTILNHNAYDPDMDLEAFRNEEILKNQEQRLSYSPRAIWREYAYFWLPIDLASVIPFDWLLKYVLHLSTVSDIGLASKLLKLLRLARLIKIFKFHLQKDLLVLHKTLGTTTVEILKMFVVMCILCHYVACGFYFIAVTTDASGNGTWLEDYLGTAHATEKYSSGNIYMNSIYWGFTTMTSVGYGDVVPITNVEKAYAVFVMCSGVALMAVITGKLAAVLATYDAQTALVQSQLQSVQSYCKYRNLPLALRKTVLRYFDVKSRQKAVCNEEEILRDMSPSLKAQVVCYIFKRVIQSVPFFRGCSELFLSAVLCCMEPILFAPADIIIQKGQRELAMYILTKGRAAVVSHTGKVIKELSMGTSVGEIGLFFGVRRTATVCSITFCDTFKLMQNKFLKVQEMYPDMQQLIDDQAEAMFNEGLSCYICGKTGHISVQCMESISHDVLVHGPKDTKWDSEIDSIRAAVKARSTNLGEMDQIKESPSTVYDEYPSNECSGQSVI